ncbi:hypothetical protein D9619_006817 [Psilocybe cf. subviscida]|uniref:pyranose dehydrogenase (acceptor) n=1 Tax=Psilocybe cf. subviscida TaxID=2480587 RepID=A0A8H5B412_9AGAR|nr:hypothetical protein D9619_006817 [Psilocybe cf. subviscida]
MERVKSSRTYHFLLKNPPQFPRSFSHLYLCREIRDEVQSYSLFLDLFSNLLIQIAGLGVRNNDVVPASNYDARPWLYRVDSERDLRVSTARAIADKYILYPGGTAGNVVANRLTENPRVSVLVIEAGGLPDGNLNISIPFFAPRATPKTSVDWNYTTVPQPGLNGRVLTYPRGFVLGGSSSVNYLVYTRGSKEDYDRYARLSGDPGWGWDRLLPYFKKNEALGPPADRHNTAGQFSPSVHGFNGINSVSLYGFPEPIDGRVIETTKQLAEFPFNVDYNSGNHLGIGWSQFTIKNGARSSSATSYLGPKFIVRKNLHVLINTEVSRVLSSGLKQGQHVFNIVQYRSHDGSLKTVIAKREVILSAGAVNSPRILLHSGIGNSTLLSQFGIPTLVDNPSVGRNLSDHPVASNVYTTNSPNTYEALTQNATATQEAIDLWKNTRTGIFASGTINHLGFIRLPANASIFATNVDPAAGPKTAHFELIIGNGVSRPPFPAAGHFFSISTVFLTPTSRGSITINSNNPFDAPLIDTGFLTTEFDIFALRESVKSARRFVAAPAWANHTVARVSTANTDAEIEDFVRNSSGTLFHPMGTAAMTPRNADFGVVNPDLLVKKVVGLRIVDASVMPIVPSAHTQAVTYVFAERASDLIKAKWHI